MTGAASGLGLATAKAFAESGASVVLADWNEKAVQAEAKKLSDQGHKTLGIRWNALQVGRQVSSLRVVFCSQDAQLLMEE